METLATLPFVAQPGNSWVYGYNTDILGCVVERASRMPLDEFVRTRITGPLGMKDTQFYLAPAQRNRLAAVYSSSQDGTITRAPDGVMMIQMLPNTTGIADRFNATLYQSLLDAPTK